ncbi:hypothetical protein ACFWWT_36500 [Streptomyces sp. NPDC058676]|uniref:hypothetical protein n=1 Tax=unclassified Streptomyces TaxID=2593676 RepID=UPI003665CB4C
MRERTTPGAWAQAADQTRHVVVDRAHRLPGDALELLAELGRRACATVWLIWPTEDDKYVPAPLRAFRDAGYRFHAIDFLAFMRELPPPPRVLTNGLRADAKTPWAEGTGPALPMQDFPVFLAHCRHKLPGNTFTAVRAVYDRQVHLADQWLTGRGMTGHTWTPGSPGHTRALAARLTFHLRDHRIGPAPDQAHALTRLRGIQTALFLRGYLLRWQYETLGAGPTTRLLSQLTARVCDKLRAAATIEDAAATALSIHLSHPPTGLGLITCGNTAPDGRTIRLPVTGSPYATEETRYLRVPWRWKPHPHAPTELTALQVLHLESDEPVRLPDHAAPLIAAHLAYRRQQGATDTDPLFLHPDSPQEQQEPRTRPARSGRPHLLPHPPQPGLAPPLPLPPRRRGPARRPAGRMDAPPRPRPHCPQRPRPQPPVTGNEPTFGRRVPRRQGPNLHGSLKWQPALSGAARASKAPPHDRAAQSAHHGHNVCGPGSCVGRSFHLWKTSRKRAAQALFTDTVPREYGSALDTSRGRTHTVFYLEGSAVRGTACGDVVLWVEDVDHALTVTRLVAARADARRAGQRPHAACGVGGAAQVGWLPCAGQPVGRRPCRRAQSSRQRLG